MDHPRILSKKPLIEAIFEARWALEKGPLPDVLRDPHYKFLLGRLFESVRADFPFREELPIASMPEEITAHTVHHRFRVAANSWPVIQIGPGILTVNDTANYAWDRFETLIVSAIDRLLKAHPEPDSLRFETLMLRFLNGIQLDATKKDVLRFLAEKMRVAVSFPKSIFADGNVQEAPHRLATEVVFRCSRPGGAFLLKFHTGRRDNVPTLIFELWFLSSGVDVPRMPDGFREWAGLAHVVIEKSFFHLIEGELVKEFDADG